MCQLSRQLHVCFDIRISEIRRRDYNYSPFTASPSSDHMMCTANQIVCSSFDVHSTLCRRCAGIKTQSPCFMTRGAPSPSNKSPASPLSTVTYSVVAWSYHSPGGVQWPCDTMRSILNPSARASVRKSSALPPGSGKFSKRFPDDMYPVPTPDEFDDTLGSNVGQKRLRKLNFSRSNLRRVR
jgi:hypothetical protein